MINVYENEIKCPNCGKSITWANTYAHVLTQEMEDNIYCPHCDKRLHIKTKIKYTYTVEYD